MFDLSDLYEQILYGLVPYNEYALTILNRWTLNKLSTQSAIDLLDEYGYLDWIDSTESDYINLKPEQLENAYTT